MPAVSVIVPTRNRADFVGNAVRSVFAQTVDDLECIVVDGGSTDATGEVLDQIDDDRLTVIRRDRPHGLANARNVALDRAQGEHVLFLDDDDRLRPSATERLLGTIQQAPNAIGAVGHRLDVYPDGTESVNTIDYPRLDRQILRNGGGVGGPTGTLVCSSALERVDGFDERFPAVEDIDLWLRLSELGYFAVADTVISERYYHPDQITNNRERMVRGRRQLLAVHGDELGHDRLAAIRFSLGNYQADHGDIAAARREFRQSIAHQPTKRGVLFWALSHVGRPGIASARRLKALYDRAMDFE